MFMYIEMPNIINGMELNKMQIFLVLIIYAFMNFFINKLINFSKSQNDNN